MINASSINVIEVTDDNRSAMTNMIIGMYKAEGCGICEKSGADVFWFNPVSRCAHSVCYGEIKSIEADLIATINSIFKDNGDRNLAHIAAIRAVKNALDKVPIKIFLETNGSEKLKTIFDSVGIAAVKTYSSNY